MFRAALAVLILIILPACAARRPAAPSPARPPHPAAPIPTLPATALALASRLGFDTDATNDLFQGRIITRTLEPGHPTELALAAAMIINTPADDLARFLEAGGSLRA